MRVRGPPPHIAARTELPELLLLLDEKNRERKRSFTQDTFWPQNLFDGRKCSLRWEILTQGLDAGTECWHQIDVVHSFGHWSTEADLSPCARLV